MEIKSELESLALQQQIINPTIHSEETNKGHGYLGTVRFVTITGKDKSNNKVSLPLVLKCGLLNSNLRDLYMVQSTVAHEMFMYKTVFPALRVFENKHGIHNGSDQIVPKCYAVLENKESIIMENLKEYGYTNFNQHLEMDDQHVRLILSQYAKFHATTFALQIQEPDTFHNLAKNLNKILLPFFKKSGYYTVLIKLAKNAQLALNPDTDANIINKYSAFLNTLEETLEQLMHGADKPLLILHGDSWFNNMLIKYSDMENPKKPTSVRLIDFQFAYVGESPVFDLVWFFYTCSTSQVLENMKTYQHYYYAAFAKHLTVFGLDPETTYTYSQFQEEWKKIARYGLIVATFFRYVLLFEETEAADHNKIIELGISAETFKGYETMNNIKKYYERIRNVIIHFVSNDFI